MSSLSSSMFRFLAILPALVALSGCSVGGYFLGRGIDDPRDFPEPVPLDKPITITEGAEVLVVANTDSVYRGRYFGMLHQPGDDYRARFIRWRDSVGAGSFPVVPGDTVVVYTEKIGTRQHSVQGIFIGIDGSAILVKHPDARNPLPILVSRISALADASGNSIGNEEVTRLVAEQVVPFTQTIVLGLEGRVVRIPLNNVREFSLMPRDQIAGRLIGTALGLAIDIAVLYALINHEEEPSGQHNYGFDWSHMF
jgi:hypothetical protein